ncbi:hypothetical protein LTR17_022664 [Elasticomyces elasticus]|nr:hypothetical protein LTR17_022664 [Elasticomyces elasticus]
MPSFKDLIKRRPTSAKPKPSFLSLPGEIRNEIYAQLYSDIDDRVVLALDPATRGLISKVKLFAGHDPTKRKPKNHNLAFLSTNRQIRREAYGYVYHGQVPTELRLPDTPFWLIWNITCEWLMPKLVNGLRKHGDNLDHIKHLKLVGETALLALTHDEANIL